MKLFLLSYLFSFQKKKNVMVFTLPKMIFNV